MDSKTATSLKSWLKELMPYVAESLANTLDPETLHEFSQTKAVTGPIVLDLEDCNAPITALHFYTVVIEDHPQEPSADAEIAPSAEGSFILAVKVCVKDKDDETRESYGFHFDMAFTSFSDFPTVIQDEEHLQQLFDTIMARCEELL